MRNFDGQNTQISQDFTASNLPGSKNQCYNIREVVSVELNFEGVVVGVMSLVIIGAFHPLGVACIWSIRELKEQARRVERGWFPKNPKRK